MKLADVYKKYANERAGVAKPSQLLRDLLVLRRDDLNALVNELLVSFNTTGDVDLSKYIRAVSLLLLLYDDTREYIDDVLSQDERQLLDTVVEKIRSTGFVHVHELYNAKNILISALARKGLNIFQLKDVETLVDDELVEIDAEGDDV